MSDSVFDLESTQEVPAPDDVPPEFGLVDIVEAFTAMRHEWRGQTKESRAATDSIQAAVTNIQSLEAKLLAQTAGGSSDEANKLAKLIADTDHHLTRVVEAVTQSERNRRQREESDLDSVQQFFDEMGALARWLARPLLTFVRERFGTERTTENPTVDAVCAVLARLRQAMKDCQIQRFDALGQAFDAATMNAIGTVESQDYPSGHVAEQISPGYLWRGTLLRFADVRVAT